MKDTINNPQDTDKTKQPVHCPFCSFSINICYGFYYRAHPEQDEPVKIQRYMCKAPHCPVKTFSILPFPFLRIVRHMYHTAEMGYSLSAERMSQACVCRILGLARGMIRYLFEFGKRFFPFLDHEKGIADWGPAFEARPCSVWPWFIRDFSHAFYPKRYGMLAPTQ